MNKCDTYKINPMTRPLGFFDSIKTTIEVIAIPFGAAFITAIIGIILIGIF